MKVTFDDTEHDIEKNEELTKEVSRFRTKGFDCKLCWNKKEPRK